MDATVVTPEAYARVGTMYPNCMGEDRERGWEEDSSKKTRVPQTGEIHLN